MISWKTAKDRLKTAWGVLRGKESPKAEGEKKELGERAHATREHLNAVNHLLWRAVGALRKDLKMSEEGYNMVVGTGHAHPRDYFFYGILDEVMKAGFGVELTAGALDSDDYWLQSESKGKLDNLERVMVETIITELHVWQRKMAEVFVDLVNFGDTNEQEAYRGYLAVRELDGFSLLQRDSKEFHGHESRNISFTMDTLRETMKSVLAAMKVDTLWFMHDGRKDDCRFKTIRQRVLSALKKARDGEKIFFGASYEELFGRTSTSLHNNIGGRNYPRNKGLVYAEMVRAITSCVYVLERIHELLGTPPSAPLQAILKILRDSDPDGRFKKLVAREFEIGDMVIAYDDLAKIIDKKVSDYGYIAYHVEYINKPPIPSIKDDWFPSVYVRRLGPSQAGVKDYVKSILDKMPELGEEERKMLLEAPSSMLYEGLTIAMGELDAHGVLIPGIVEEERRKKEEKEGGS